MTPVLFHKLFVESQSPAVRAHERIILEIAPTEIPVLILGEGGTGKEVMALQIHRLSGRQNQPFFKLICNTLTPEGFAKFFERSNGEDGSTRGMSSSGSVFLEEISELDPAYQPKLLHALPDEAAPPDDHRPGARVISSSRRNLEDEVRAGRFREDLYYRLNGVCLRLPPLRHRKEDIPNLVDFFLTKYSVPLGRSKPTLSPHTFDRLLEYSWPGNIRQLESAVRKIVALGDERLAVEDLGSLALESLPSSGAGGRLSLKQASRAASQQAERELILRALERTRWNRKRAARELQISYKALLYKLKQIGLDNSADSLNTSGERQ